MRIYFTSDIHGSTKCWLKFLSSASFYGADVVIVGGDITGKFLIPVVRSGGGYRAHASSGIVDLAGPAELAQFEQGAANAGTYTALVDMDELETLSRDQDAVERLLGKLVLDRIDAWVKVADERLAKQSARCFVSGGNDDSFEVDERLGQSKRIEIPEGVIVDVGDGIQMFGLGFANPTPWHCPRDLSEAELGDKIDALASQLREPGQSIFDIHVPPYASGLDLAPLLEDGLKVARGASGDVQYVPVGSTAVRTSILKYQPLLGLHGHVHESGGVKRLGSTTIVNPGSEYQGGILHGVLIDVPKGKSRVTAQLVAG